MAKKRFLLRIDQRVYDAMEKWAADDLRSVNAQMLMVFFLPLGFAGLHLGFAFPMLHKLLMLFCLYDLPLLLGTTAITFVVFGLLYALVYRATSNAYYRLVSGIAKDEKAQQ